MKKMWVIYSLAVVLSVLPLLASLWLCNINVEALKMLSSDKLAAAYELRAKTIESDLSKCNPNEFASTFKKLAADERQVNEGEKLLIKSNYITNILIFCYTLLQLILFLYVFRKFSINKKHT